MSAPALAEVAAPATAVRSPGLDPRTKALLVIAASAAVMGPGGLRFVPAALALAVGLALWERAWARAASLTAAAAAMWAVGWLLPEWWANPVTAVASLACAYLIRFTAAAGVGMHLIATTTPTALGFALRAWNTPRPVAVTLAVMLRFFPVVAAEAAAVLDAMRLRGLAGVGGFLRHPLLSVERFTVPLIAASLRASEDLSAAAVLRGFGSPRTPTALHPPRFGPADAVLVLGTAALAAAALLLPQPLT
ncbi:energy-coupling factor transporter transmembrane component T [Glycomyces terrestris]|uniref:Energy-coupling factor transporter transmembrane protein EcfT n=1 Tax=Glycomyces terrestris TaxID=2493553 RepID=A0A426V3H3_9ACTN|nr:energy-coupling factor transporter transmembrane component T [Glycomyces terrestris]RRS01402.1 energy-coupling factor transporter transmembrane protein EcfT [Glycomyces terrestris]